MSFAQTVKTEICRSSRFDNRCCKVSQLYGMLLFAAIFEEGKVKLSVESLDAAKRFVTLASDLFDCPTDLFVSEAPDGRLYTVTTSGEDAGRLYHAMGYSGKDVTLRINRGVLECADCAHAFLSGAFLAAGTVTIPDKAYRLELVSPKVKRLSELRLLLQEEEIEMLLAERKNNHVLYVKASESIEDFLNLIGAQNAAYDIMNVKIYKDIRNRANRAANCETANITKNVEAAASQRRAIETLLARGALEALPKELREAARLRMEYPEYTLSELAAMTEPRIGKSGLANRLSKLTKLAGETKK